MTFEIPSDVTAGLAQMERWNLPGGANVELAGTRDVMENLSHIIATAHDRAFNRLRLNGERILSASHEEVPVDMTYEKGRLKGGFLKSTGTVEVSPEDPDVIMIGYNAPYAAIQHEDLTFHHTKQGAKAKYLEDPAWRIAPTIAEDIVNALHEVLL